MPLRRPEDRSNSTTRPNTAACASTLSRLRVFDRPECSGGFIAALLPAVGFGNKVPVLKPETDDRREWLLAANLNAMAFDFATRQKIQGQTLNLFILEQLPVVPPERHGARELRPQDSRGDRP